MPKVENISGNVLSAPVIEMESPFYISFRALVKLDIVQCMFIGDLARALVNNIRPGDEIMIPKAIIDDGRLVFDKMYLDVSAAKGRNINVWG